MKKRYKVILIIVLLVAFAGGGIFAFYRSGGENIRQKPQKMMQEWKGKAYTDELVYQGTEYKYRSDMINVLCMGIDKEEVMWERDDDGGSIGQADMVLLLSVDLTKKQIRIINIPRDTMVSIVTCDPDGNPTGAFEGQLTLQYAYADGQERSCALMTQQVADLFWNEVPINGYIAMNLSGIGILNDAVGGVTIQMNDDYTLYNEKFTKGATVTLHGHEAQQYVQGRDITTAGSAYARIDRQKQYMRAFIGQAKSAWKKNPLLPIRVLQDLTDDLETNLTLQEMFYLGMHAVNYDITDENMYILQGNIEKEGRYEAYYLDNDSLQEMIINLFYEPVE